MKKQLVLIKLGGSLITNKRKEDTARIDIIERCSEQIEGIKRMYPSMDLVIGTGAGSYGHIQARRYRLESSDKLTEQFYGMCTIHNNVRKLNELIVDTLTSKGLSAFSISPSAIFMANDGVVTSSFLSPVRQLLSSGCIPMLHGDAVLDPVRGLIIMSTEKVLQACLEDLRESYEEIIVVYCMDVDGIWDENHEVISVFEKDRELFTHQDNIMDVTGGIESKLKSARRAAKLADRVHLISGKGEGTLLKIISGERAGTQVR